MATLDRFDILSAALKSAFITGFSGVVDPAPIEKGMQIMPSTARVEHMPWLSPTPAIARWLGHRRMPKIFNTLYRLENLAFDASFSISDDDVNDFQVEGWPRKAQELGKKAAIFPNRESLRMLNKAALQFPATGPVASPATDTTCWDGSQLFAPAAQPGALPTGAQHLYGTSSAAPTGGTDGGNVINFQAQTGTGTYKVVAVVTAAEYGIKPILWQNRMAAELRTDAGTPQADFKRETAWWVTLRGAVGFAYWWDVILVNVTNLPTVQEAQTIFGNVKSRFRTFGLPTVLASDTIERVHEQVTFTNKNLLLIVSTGLENIFDQVRTLSLIANTENPFQNKFDLTASGFLD